MKKITILSLHLGVGGIEKYITSLSKMLSSDYEVEMIITYKLKEVPSFNIGKNIKITYLIDGGPNRDEIRKCIKRHKYLKLLKEIIKAIKILCLKRIRTKKAIKKLETDYLITTRTYETKLANKILKNSKIKLIATDHNYPDKKYKTKLINATTNYDRLVLVNNEIRDIYKQEIGLKAICINNFIDDLSKEKSNLSSKNIISVGRFSKEKGFIDLIDIMSLIIKKDNKITLTLVGDGEEKENIQNRIKELKLENNIKLTGYLNQEEIKSELLKSSLFCMTSEVESFGLVILEAMNLGVPVVAFDSACGPRVLLRNGAGILIKERNKEDFANCVLDLLNNKSKLKKLSDLSKKEIENYTSDVIKQEWLKLLNDVNKLSRKKVMFISSTGGHLNELLMLKSMFNKYNYFLITENTASNKNLKNKYGKKKVGFLVYGTRKHIFSYIFKIIFNSFKSLYYFIKIRPSFIVSTGAHTAGPMCLIGHLLGAKIIFIETFANSETKTITGSLVYKFADLFIVQWESMLENYPNAVFGGWIY